MMYGAFQGWKFIAAAGHKLAFNFKFLNQTTEMFKKIWDFMLYTREKFNKNNAPQRQ